MRNYIIAGLLCCSLGLSAQQNPDYKQINDELTARWKDEITINKNDFPYPYITAYSNDHFMYYWDTYFINRGLIATGNLKLAKQNTLNILNIVDRFGFMGNVAVNAYGQNRSQPPYLSLMVSDIYAKEKDTAFLNYAYPILKKEYHFWTDNGVSTLEDHSTWLAGLQRFSHHATKEELLGFFESIADRVNFDRTLPDEQKIKLASDYCAEAATGMDFTPRFENHCTQYVAVDLNCLLYSFEKNMAYMSKEIGLTNEPDWNGLAEQRKVLINKYCWDEKSGLYYDFNYVTGKKSKVAAVTTFQPLWAGIASASQAKRVVANIGLFETEYGLTTTVKGNHDEKYQWGSNSIWAPMQLLAVEGMQRYGFKQQANTTAREFMWLIAKNYDSPASSKAKLSEVRTPGFSYEKYKADGTINDDEYIAAKMMGWTAGVYNCLYQIVYHEI
jgi:alpha,alpha-trehalase